VRRVDTGWVVAAMQNSHAIRDLTVSKLPCKPMGERVRHATMARTYDAVSSISCALPQPAGVLWSWCKVACEPFREWRRLWHNPTYYTASGR
jgi:hypothetical protein